MNCSSTSCPHNNVLRLDAGSSSSQALPSRFLPTVIGSASSQTSSGRALSSTSQSQSIASQEALLESDVAQKAASMESENPLLGFSLDGEKLPGMICLILFLQELLLYVILFLHASKLEHEEVGMGRMEEYVCLGKR